MFAISTGTRTLCNVELHPILSVMMMQHANKVEGSGSGVGDQNEIGDKICRDFLRNVCRRGSKCRFRHPENEELESLGGNRSESLFCHDYQNKTCNRPNCKFIHCTREEQIHFAASGELPMHVLDMIIERGLVSEVLFSHFSGPVCKDFLKGECKRAGKCRFRHLTYAELRDTFGAKPSKRCETSETFSNANGMNCNGSCNSKSRQSPCFEANPVCSSMRPYRSLDNGWMPPGAPEPKRCHYDASVTQYHVPMHHHGPYSTTMRSLEEENAILSKKVERLEREVSDLKATNEFLLDQNAQLRYCKGRVTTVNSLNTVSVTGVAATATPVASVSVPAIAQISQTGGHTAATTAVVATPAGIAPVTISMSQPLTTPGMPTTAIPISISSAVNAIQGPVVSAGTATALVTYPAVMTQNIRTSGILPN